MMVPNAAEAVWALTTKGRPRHLSVRRALRPNVEPRRGRPPRVVGGFRDGLYVGRHCWGAVQLSDLVFRRLGRFELRTLESLSPLETLSSRAPARGFSLRMRQPEAIRHTRRPVVAANLSVLFTIHHHPAQFTLLRPHVFPEHRFGHDRGIRARTRPGCIYCASPWSDLCAVYRSSGKGARERAQK